MVKGTAFVKTFFDLRQVFYKKDIIPGIDVPLSLIGLIAEAPSIAGEPGAAHYPTGQKYQGCRVVIRLCGFASSRSSGCTAKYVRGTHACGQRGRQSLSADGVSHNLWEKAGEKARR